MAEIDEIEAPKHGGIWRNATSRRRVGVLAVLLAGAGASACASARPDLHPPAPRRSLGAGLDVVTERATPIPAPSSSALSGDVRFLGESPEVDLGPVVVYLVPVARGEAETAEPPDPVVATSRTAEFDPELAAVSRGQRLVLANEGPLSHGLFSADLGGNRVDLPPGTRSAPLRIPPLGPIRFYCALHTDEMFVVFGAAADHVAIVEAGETYTFQSVDAGRYTLTIWSEFVEGPVREVVVDGYTTAVEPVWIDPELLRRLPGGERSR